MAEARILIVEDENIVARDIAERLKALNYDVIGIVASGEEAIHKAQEMRPDIILMDIMLRGEIDGVQAAEKIKSFSTVPIIYTTALAEEATVQRTKSTEPYGYLLKPIEERELRIVIEIALYKHQTEEKLKQNRQWLEMTLKSIGEGVIATDQEGRVVFMNKIAEKLTGWDQEDALGRKFSQIVSFLDEATRASIEDISTKVIEKKASIGISENLILVSKAGKESPVIQTVAPLEDARGNITGAVLSVRDVTSQRRAREMLKQEYEFIKTILDTTNALVIVLDKDGRIISFNKACERVTGYAFDEVQGKLIWDFLLKREEMEKVRKFFDSLQCGTISSAYENHWISKEGALKLIRWTNSVLCDEKGDVEFLLGTGIDITEHVKTEKALRDKDVQYRQLIETMNDGLGAVDEKGIVTYANEKFCEMVGYPLEEVVGRPICDFIDETSKEVVQQEIGKLRNRNQSTYELVLKKKSGESLYVIVAPEPIVDTDGKYRGSFGVVTDITQRKLAEEALRFRTYELSTRAKELNCLYTIASLLAKPNMSVEDIFQRTVEIVPQALQYPEITCARIFYEGDEYKTTHFKQTQWGLMRDITVRGEKCGSVEVFYVEAKPNLGDGPFLREEKELLNAIAVQLSNIIERKLAESECVVGLEKLQKTTEGIIEAIAKTSEMRDPYTAGHQKRVSQLAACVAVEMGLEQTRIDEIKMAAAIHDIGKIYVPAEILSKPGTISEMEYSIIKTHPQVGHDILKHIEFPWPVDKIVLQHHERINGSGYPLGLRGDEMLLDAKILAVADVVEAMASHRPYRPSLGVEMALEEISRNSGTLYDEEVVRICLDLFMNKGFQFE